MGEMRKRIENMEIEREKGKLLIEKLRQNNDQGEKERVELENRIGELDRIIESDRSEMLRELRV